MTLVLHLWNEIVGASSFLSFFLAEGIFLSHSLTLEKVKHSELIKISVGSHSSCCLTLRLSIIPDSEAQVRSEMFQFRTIFVVLPINGSVKSILVLLYWHLQILHYSIFWQTSVLKIMRSFRIMVTTLLAFWNLASVYHVSERSSEDIFRHPSCLTAPVQESWELGRGTHGQDIRIWKVDSQTFSPR